MPYRYVWRMDLDPGKREAFIKNWHDASLILQEYPGARGTRLHQVVDEPDALVAIAEWESKEARHFMLNDVAENKSERAKRWNKFPKNDEFGKVTTLAKLDELDFVKPEEV